MGFFDNFKNKPEAKAAPSPPPPPPSMPSMPPPPMNPQAGPPSMNNPPRAPPSLSPPAAAPQPAQPGPKMPPPNMAPRPAPAPPFPPVAKGPELRLGPSIVKPAADHAMPQPQKQPEQRPSEPFRADKKIPEWPRQNLFQGIKERPKEKPKIFDAHAPESLPKMPVLKREQKPIKKEELPQPFFVNTQEKIPFFPVTDISPLDGEVLEELPLIDTENVHSFHYTHMEGPIFVRTDSYSEILSNLDWIKGHVDNSTDVIYNLENLKKNTDLEHKNYKQVLEDIQRKLIYVDRILFAG